jgi:superfamily II helicase
VLLTIPAAIRLEGALVNYNKKGRVSHTCSICQQDTSNGDATNLNYYKLGTKKVCQSCIKHVLRHPSLKEYEYVHTAVIDETAFYKKILAVLKDEQFMDNIQDNN